MSAFGAAIGKGFAGLGGPGAAAAIVAGGILVGLLGGGFAATRGSSQQPASATGKLAVFACPDSGAPLATIQGGQKLLVTGRTADNAWLRIHFPEPGRTEAWVQASPLQVDGSVATLPVAECSPELAVGSPSIEPAMSLTAVANNPPTDAPSSSPEATPSPAPTPSPTASASLAPNSRPTLASLTTSTNRISYDTGDYCPNAVKRVTFRVKAGDAAGVASVALFWREPGAGSYAKASMTRISGNARSGTWQVTLDTTANGITRAGKLAFYAVATDDQGSTRRIPASGANTINVAVCVNTGPAITSVTSSGGRTLYSDPAGEGCSPTTTNITAVVKDAQDVRSVTLLYRRPGLDNWSSKPMTDATIPGQWYANLDTLGDKIAIGTLRWYIRAVDGKGVASRIDARAISVKLCDRTPPAVAGWTFSSKGAIYVGGPCVPTSMSTWLDVIDTGSGVASVKVRLRNTQTGGLTSAQSASKTSSGWKTTWSGPDLGVGTFNLQVLATDKAGNSTGWSSTRALFSVVFCTP